MSGTPESTPNVPKILTQMDELMSIAFQQELPRHDTAGMPELFRELSKLPDPAEQTIRRFILRASDRLTNPSENAHERRAMARGVLFTLAMIRFIEDSEELREWFTQESLSDDGGVAIQPPSDELGDGQSAGPLFLAPPDPELRPEA
jgi:hypothetical protein